MNTAITLNFLERNGTQVMSSLELAALCVGTKKDAHSDFLKKARKVLKDALGNFSERETYGNNNTREVLYLPEREACLMAMSYSFELQAYVYDEWQKLKSQQQFSLPKTYVEALGALLESEKAKEQALLTIQEQAPKVEYHDVVLDTSNGMPVNVIAKELGMSAMKLNRKLNELHIQYKQSGQWFLYAEHQDKDWVVISTHTYTNSKGEVETNHSMKWTEKGRQAILHILHEGLTSSQARRLN